MIGTLDLRIEQYVLWESLEDANAGTSTNGCLWVAVSIYVSEKHIRFAVFAGIYLYNGHPVSLPARTTRLQSEANCFYVCPDTT